MASPPQNAILGRDTAAHYDSVIAMAAAIQWNEWDSNQNTWLHWQIVTWDNLSSQDRLWETLDDLNKLSDIIPQINTFNNIGFTPLHLAVISGDPELVKELLQYGGDSEIRCLNSYFQNKTCIEIAKHYNNIPILKVLLEDTDLDR